MRYSPEFFYPLLSKYTRSAVGLLCSTIISALFIAALFLPLFTKATESTNAMSGLEIATEADLRNTGFNNTSVDMTMTLIGTTGNKTVREMRQKVLEVQGDGDKSVMVFDRPPDLKGTAVLTYTHKVGDDDQWLYLPSANRVKRISSSNKSGPFLGSEFAFEDLTSQEVEKYTYRFVQEEVFEGDACYVVERVPVDKNSGYSRQLTWVDKQEFRTRKIDFYDPKNELLKTMLFKDYRQYLQKYWRADELEMINHQTGKSTILRFLNYEFDGNLSERDFTKDALSSTR